ncbi:MAG: FKBP-type peptidyl-prolyl cis-trans isomerase [Crocinitomicaceae bacterium]
MNEVSYAIGTSIAGSLINQNLDDINIDDFVLGIKDALSGQPLKVSPQKANELIQDHLDEKNKQMFEKNKTEGQAFLAENGKREGVVTLDSGLQYEIIEEGTGAKPGAESQVTVHYTGTLIDGTVFDSSVQRGQPASFGVNQVIKGWTEALQLMPEGSKWKLAIPEELAYCGNPHPGGPIKPFMALLFEVELISVN